MDTARDLEAFWTTIAVGRCSQDGGSRVYLVAIGLLQLSSIRHLRHLTVENAAARLINGTRRCDLTTRVLNRSYTLAMSATASII